MNKLRVKVEERDFVKPGFNLLIIFLSLLVGIVVMGLIFLLNGVNPFYGIYKIFSGSFGSLYGIKSTIVKAIPLILISSGLCLAFRAKFWNIGAEGQLLFGAIFATWVGLNWAAYLPGWLAVPLMFLAGFIGGGLWGLLPVLFKMRLGINEVISTLMLNYIAAGFLTYLIVGPWKGETQYGFPYTDNFPDSGILGLIPGTRIHYVTLIVALIAIVVLFFVIARSKFGYEVRVIGENREAARYAGINFFKSTLIMMLISGGLAGMAGVGEVAGVHHHLSYPDAISAGYGFTAIIVAWLAKLNPMLTIFSGLFFAGILVGGDAIQISLGMPAATINIFNGVILVALIAGDFFQNNRLRISLNKEEKNK